VRLKASESFYYKQLSGTLDLYTDAAGGCQIPQSHLARIRGPRSAVRSHVHLHSHLRLRVQASSSCSARAFARSHMHAAGEKRTCTHTTSTQHTSTHARFPAALTCTCTRTRVRTCRSAPAHAPALAHARGGAHAHEQTPPTARGPPANKRYHVPRESRDERSHLIRYLIRFNDNTLAQLQRTSSNGATSRQRYNG
jgi:hypothetical protein